MAKRMKFSVVGLPHYTIWHLYEPSVDDLRHMEEMELEKQQQEAKEQEEKAQAARQQKLKEKFKDAKEERQRDKAQLAKKVGKTEGNAAGEKKHEEVEKSAVPAKGQVGGVDQSSDTAKEKTQQDSSGNFNNKL